MKQTYEHVGWFQWNTFCRGFTLSYINVYRTNIISVIYKAHLKYLYVECMFSYAHYKTN